MTDSIELKTSYFYNKNERCINNKVILYAADIQDIVFCAEGIEADWVAIRLSSDSSNRYGYNRYSRKPSQLRLCNLHCYFNLKMDDRSESDNTLSREDFNRLIKFLKPIDAKLKRGKK